MYTVYHRNNYTVNASYNLFIKLIFAVYRNFMINLYQLIQTAKLHVMVQDIIHLFVLMELVNVLFNLQCNQMNNN